ncbi:MAG: TetR/AcrR family transcriptional regulator [Micromonosporaceae bacterium]
MEAVQRAGKVDGGHHRRADARKNIAAILDAATECLARDPDASVNAIAKAAGVGRVTLYGHFDSRATLVTAVVERALRETDAALEATDLDGDPRDALVRLITSTWRLTSQFGALVVAAERELSAEQVVRAHAEPMRRVERLIERGRQDGVFRADLPAHWLSTVLHNVTHAAAGALHRGEMTAEEAPRIIAATMLAAITPPGRPVPEID